MGRKKRPSAQQQNGQHQNSNNVDPQPKKARVDETGESYAVKKYRPTKIYTAMEAFVKYTKQHRMLDASYVRWRTGVTTEKPFVFSTRVGGTDLGWGRGKNREAAMDCACRATFSLVAAHGYNNFPVDADCLTVAPTDPLPPPPPPPPPPPISLHPPLPPGMPPPFGVLPHGLPPGLPPLHQQPCPPHLPPPSADLIPQAKIVSDLAPTASSLSSSTTAEAGTGSANPVASTISLSLNVSKKKLKGGLTLVYSTEVEGCDEMSMEETRSLLPRYQKLLSRAASSTA